MFLNLKRKSPSRRKRRVEGRLRGAITRRKKPPVKQQLMIP
tara:strand:- start:1199 stop:1321 length:123 start_codon:yes stop_codon:yes gene_type:complete